MNKFLIIDDRAERKKTLLNEKEILSLDAFERQGILSMRTSLEFKNMPPSKDDIDEAINGYSVIAIHRSWLVENDLINDFEEYMSKDNSDKIFIIFSGGTTTTGLTNNYKSLYINAGNFYTPKLIEFIENNKEDNNTNLLKFLYGNSWRLPLLLEYRNLLWSGRESTDIEKEEFLRTLIYSSKYDILSLDYINDEIEKEKLNYSQL